MTTQNRFRDFPPILVRLLARQKSGRPLTVDEIVLESGLSREEVACFSLAPRWTHIPVEKAFAFCRGCGLNMDDNQAWRRVDDYIRKFPTFRYLRASNNWDDYRAMILKWAGLCDPEHPRLQALQKRLLNSKT